MAGRFRSSPHSANSARRRRMILLRGPSTPVDDTLPVQVSTPRPNRRQSLNTKHTTPRIDTPPVPILAPPYDVEIDRSFSVDATLSGCPVAGLITSALPVSWLFVGDSFTPENTHEPRPWRVYTTRFSGAVRSHFHRSKDVFIDATFPGARLSEVLFDFERRIAKFEPDVCFLGLSLKDGDSKSIERFERMLVRLIRWSKKFDCQLVIQTPPCLPSRSDAELTRRLILVESVRGITAEHAAPLVDHWAHWEESVIPTSTAERWIDPATHTPDEMGHRQLAWRLINDLKLKDVAVSESETLTPYPASNQEPQ